MRYHLVALALASVLAVGCDRSDPPSAQPKQNVPAAPVVNVKKCLPTSSMNPETISPPGEVRLPAGPRVGDLAVGSSAWIRPWTIWVTSNMDGDTNYYVNGYHPCADKPEDESWVRVVRQQDGFMVYLEKSKFRWSAMNMETTPGQYVSLPVAGFVGQ